MNRLVVAVVVVAAGATAVLAQADPGKTRRDLMTHNQDGENILYRMVRGETAFDATRAKAVYDQWADTAKQLPALWPDNSKGGSGDNRASPKIWEARADFDAKIAQFAKAVADTHDKAATLEGLKSAFSQVSRLCNDCHRDYRLRRQR